MSVQCDTISRGRERSTEQDVGRVFILPCVFDDYRSESRSSIHVSAGDEFNSRWQRRRNQNRSTPSGSDVFGWIDPWVLPTAIEFHACGVVTRSLSLPVLTRPPSRSGYSPLLPLTAHGSLIIPTQSCSATWCCCRRRRGSRFDF